MDKEKAILDDFNKLLQMELDTIEQIEKVNAKIFDLVTSSVKKGKCDAWNNSTHRHFTKALEETKNPRIAIILGLYKLIENNS